VHQRAFLPFIHGDFKIGRGDHAASQVTFPPG
jgi:hypothetical protein